MDAVFIAWASEASKQQHNQDLRAMYTRKEFTNLSLLLECITSDQSALRHEQQEDVTPSRRSLCNVWKFVNLDILISNLVCHFLAVSPPWWNYKMKRNAKAKE